MKIASDFRAALRPDWSQLETGAAARCAAGVAVPLIVGTVFHSPAVAALGAVGAISGGSLRGALAEMLDTHRAYVDALLGAFESGESPGDERLGQLRAAGRLARSNAEATIERMAHEPAHAATLDPQVAMDVLAALRRNALAALALHAAVERGAGMAHPEAALLRRLIDQRLAGLASAVRAGKPAQEMPELRRAQLALPSAAAERFGPETDIMVDAINTIAALLRQSTITGAPKGAMHEDHT